MKLLLHRLGFVSLACALLLGATAGCERRPGSGGGSADTGEILVGEYGSLTGSEASFGLSTREGIELAVDEINAAGGVLGGRKIRVIVEDTQSKPEEASNAVTKLITQDRVVAVLGEVASRRSIAGAQVCQRYQVPMITPSSTNDKVTEVGDYIFRTCFTDRQQGRALAEFAANNLQVKRAAILRDIGQDYSVGLTESITENLTRLGREVLPPINYSATDPDFRSILTSVKAQSPDAIFVTGYYTEAAIIVRQAREVGLTVPMLGGDGWVGDALANGREALNNTYISNHYATDDPTGRPAAQQFVAAYKAKFNKEPDSIAALSYDAAKVLADAINRAGSTEGAKIRDAIAATTLEGVTGRLTTNAKRNVEKPTIIQAVTFENGQMKFVYKATIQPL